MGRSPCCIKEGLNRGAWTAMEDKILTDYIKIHGEGKWRHLPKRAGLKRCGKSCRLRWLNYLRPDIKRGNITHDEEELIIRLHNLLGNRWSLIAGRLPGRTDNEIKNYWNTNIGKKSQIGNPNTSPPSGGARSLAKSAQQNPNPKARRQNLHPPSRGSCVVRTKATRCTRVVLTKDPPQLEPMVPPFATAHNVKDVKLEGLTSEPTTSPPPLFEGTNPLDFMADIEMDESFLSDLLRMDFSDPSCFATKMEDSNGGRSERWQQSPTSTDTHLLSDDSLRVTDFQSMSTLVESEFDWV